MNVQKTNEKGFTIIEVVLVLAIAALIFLMVFIALPALQRNQRDTARKSDVGTVVSSVTSYSSNNKGQLPPNTAAGANAISSGLSADITVANPAAGTSGTTVTAAVDRINLYKGVKCGAVAPNGSVTLAPGNSRSFAVVTQLEGNGETGFCQDNG